MVAHSESYKKQVVRSDWYRSLVKYEQPDLGKAIWEMSSTFIPYALLWILMVWMIQHHLPYIWTLPLNIVAAGLTVRIFIFFHDCGHGSFFASRKANLIVGYICGVLTFTPYHAWKHNHSEHHATVGDLDQRGIGDIWTLTIDEYKATSSWKRIVYHIYRNPIILFVIGPAIVFLLVQRLPNKHYGKRERESVMITNIALAAILLLAHFTIGLKTYFMIQLPMMAMAASAGTWLFYIQHQYEEVYWARHDEWDPIRAAIEGSSYYKLPKILQWFSGNIGLHHIHHLRPRIPNYNLQRCYDDIPELQDVKPVTLMGSSKSLFLRLWDEMNVRLVQYRGAKQAQPDAQSEAADNTNGQTAPAHTEEHESIKPSDLVKAAELVKQSNLVKQD